MRKLLRAEGPQYTSPGQASLRAPPWDSKTKHSHHFRAKRGEPREHLRIYCGQLPRDGLAQIASKQQYASRVQYFDVIILEWNLDLFSIFLSRLSRAKLPSQIRANS